MSSDQPSSAEVSVPIARVVLVAATAALGGFLFGFDTAVINGAVSAIGEQFSTGPFLLGFAVASALIGCAIGAWYAGRIADRYGRIRVMLIAAVAVHRQRDRLRVSRSASGILSFWRVVGGLGVGAASVIAPAYIAEVSPPAYRGRLGSLQQLAIVSGIFVALLSDAAIVAAAGTATAPWLLGLEAWRWMFLVAVVPAADLRRAGADHPRVAAVPHRARRDDQGQGGAQPLRRRQRREGLDRHPQDRRGQSPIARASRSCGAGKFGLLPIVWIGIGLSVLQQFTGINVIFYYSTTLWQAVGFTEQDSLTITVITSVTNIVTTIIAIMLIDKVGRRPLLLVGAIGQFLCLAVLTLIFATATVVDGEPVLEGAAGTIALDRGEPVRRVLRGVLGPGGVGAARRDVQQQDPRRRPVGRRAAQWAANFVISTTFPALAAVGLGLAYGVYTFFAFVAIFFVLKFVKETKGRTLESMSEEATPVA